MCVPVKEIQTLYKQTISVWKFFTDPLQGECASYSALSTVLVERVDSIGLVAILLGALSNEEDDFLH